MASLLPLGLIDFRPPLTSKRRKSLERRLERLVRASGTAGLAPSARAATAAWQVVAGPAGLRSPLRVRDGFAYLTKPSSVDPSDRRLPPPEHRPPATRIMTPRGAALRLELIALAYAQAVHRPGSRVRNSVPLTPRRADALPVGWRDLVASSSVRYGTTDVSVSVNDKKLRQLYTALDGLTAAGLVRLPTAGGPKVEREGFELLDERGPAARPGGMEPLDYTVPSSKESVFALPSSFINNGWVHLLEDGELALLLMVACRRGANPGETDVAIPGDTRVHHYGIGRDVYTSAHKMLREFGLLHVEELGRRDDGRAIGFDDDPAEAQLHRLQLLPGGFDEPAWEKVPAAIVERLA